MSFTEKAKLEIIKNLSPKPCCFFSFLKGLTVESREDSAIVFKSESKTVAEALFDRIAYLVKTFKFGPRMLTHLKLSEYKGKTVYFVYITGTDGSAFSNFDTDKLCDEDKKAFLSGVFVGFGGVTDPKKIYLLELSFRTKAAVNKAMFAFVSEGYIFKLSIKNKRFSIYLKEYDIISELLAFMNAPLNYLEIINVNVVKQQRNKANRILNCDKANIDKQLAASARQTAAIRKIIKNGMFGVLDKALKTVAETRLKNREAPLAELAELTGLSRSQIDYKLKKLMAIANKLKD